METIFNKYKNMLVIHNKYRGHVCGYNDSHIILAVETDSKDFFRKLQNPFIIDEYKDDVEFAIELLNLNPNLITDDKFINTYIT